jgi:solute carrier family 39 (zinc transporter), member 1/2/3
MESTSKYEETIEESEKAVIVAKVIAASCLFTVSVIFGILPFKLSQIFEWSKNNDPNKDDDKKSSKLVSVLLCFGGGVLLATTFLHLLPEIEVEIAILQEKQAFPILPFNIAKVLMMCGFFLIYLIDELVHGYLHSYQKSIKKKSKLSLAENETLADTLMRGASIISLKKNIHRRVSTGCLQTYSQSGSIIDMDSISEKQMAAKSMSENSNVKSTIDKSNKQGQGQHTHSHGTFPIPHSENEDMLTSSLRGLLIVLALSIHELFEGKKKLL